jgi:hypothetical protein
MDCGIGAHYRPTPQGGYGFKAGTMRPINQPSQPGFVVPALRPQGDVAAPQCRYPFSPAPYPRLWGPQDIGG